MPPPRPKDADIQDVALAAGCSISTVSKVLNNTGSISPKMRKQVMRAAEELSYSPHPGARFLRGRRSENIGLFYSAVDLFKNPFYSAVAAGVEEVLAELNYNMLIAAPQLRRGTHEPPKFVRERSVDGVLAIGRVSEPIMVKLIESGLPMVLVDTEARGQSVDSIVSDSFNGAYMATRHLIDRGHRRIGMLGASNDDWDVSTRRRFDGFMSAMREAGLSVPPAHIEKDEHGQDGGRSAIVRLLARKPDITALFVVNDEMAIGAMLGLKEAGIRVPDDISIIGFDDIQLAGMMTPGLTTMRVDMINMGRVAATVLVEKLGEKNEQPMQRVFPVSLVERQTVKTLA